jgi:glyoxylase-like metal-dependent hydrolase (beta-lactamase superfamily II)
MTKILPGIHQLRVPIPNNPLEYTNTYLVQGDDGYILIDTGVNTEEALQALEKQLSEIGIDFKDISQIVVTHAHGDHYGLVGQLKQLSQAKVSLHYLEQNLLAPRYTNMEEALRQSEQWFQGHGVPASELPSPQTAFPGMRQFSALALPDTILRGGETISAGVFNFQVVWTPGHSPGHICLYEPDQKILFAGDHILPIITPNISLQPQSKTNPLGEFLNSLNTVKQLDVAIVLPAHEHIFNDLPTRVDEIIWHHEQRNSEILEAIKTEPKTAYQISTVITWMPEMGGVSFKDLAIWDKRMAVSETLAHLEAMKDDGAVATISPDNITYYQRT